MEKILREKLVDGKFGAVTPARSRIMQAIKGKGNKSTELRFCQALASEGINSWELHAKIIGNPDVYFPAYRVAIFLDGCFWHGCPECGHLPITNTAYWKAKIGKNIERDFQKTEMLRNEGYIVIRFWEHELKNLAVCVLTVKDTLEDTLKKICSF